MAEPRRVLILAPFPPRLDGTHGGCRSLANLVLHLAERNRVALAFLRTRDEEPVDPEVSAACEIVHEGLRAGTSGSSVRPWPRAFATLPLVAAGKPLWVAARWNRAFSERVRELTAGWKPHVVQAEFSAMGQYLGVAREAGAATVVTIYEPATAAARERSHEGGPARRLGWRASAGMWARYERRLMRAVDATVVFTERDRRAMEQLCPDVSVVRIALGIPVPPTAAGPAGSDPPSLLFVGNFVHPPNLAAAKHLAERLFPPLHASFPELKLRIVGANAPESLRRLAGAGVEVTGWVPDVWPYLDEAAIFVAPLTEGGGMRVKVLEAMAAGKAVVASPLAAEGLQADEGEHLLIARSDADFTRAVEGLLADTERRSRLGRAARRWVQENLTWERCAAAYEALYERIGEGATPHHGSIHGAV